jgi:hypothetical protein
LEGKVEAWVGVSAGEDVSGGVCMLAREQDAEPAPSRARGGRVFSQGKVAVVPGLVV